MNIFNKAVVFDCDGTLITPTSTHQESLGQSALLERPSGSRSHGQSYRYQLFPGIKELLQDLTAQDFQLFVWTARDRFSTVEILKQQGVIHLFQDLRTATDAELKPHPGGLSSMLIDFKPHDVIIIGDSYTDILGAKNFGAKAIGALWCPSAKGEILQEMGAFKLANSPKDCYHFVLEWAHSPY